MNYMYSSMLHELVKPPFTRPWFFSLWLSAYFKLQYNHNWLYVLPELLKYDRGVAKMTTGGQNPTINDIWAWKDPDASEGFRAMGTRWFNTTILCLNSKVVLVYPQEHLLIVPSPPPSILMHLNDWEC